MDEVMQVKSKSLKQWRRKVIKNTDQGSYETGLYKELKAFNKTCGGLGMDFQDILDKLIYPWCGFAKAVSCKLQRFIL